MNKLNILEPNENTKLGLYFSVENKTLESSLWAPTAKSIFVNFQNSKYGRKSNF